jgi:hypothetical protein
MTPPQQPPPPDRQGPFPGYGGAVPPPNGQGSFPGYGAAMPGGAVPRPDGQGSFPGYGAAMPGGAVPPSNWSPPRPRRQRSPWLWPMVTLGAVVVVAAAVLVPLALSRHGAVAASAPATGPTSPAPPTAIQPYTPPSDGTGWSTRPMNQPMPVPDLFSATDPCAWIADVLPRLKSAVHATGKVDEGGDGCHVYLAGGDIAQLITSGPYTAVDDPTQFVRPASVDGMDGREFAFSGQGQGECAVTVNYRAFTSTEVNVWNPDRTRDATGRAARCRTALTVQGIIVKRFVPLTGGTPYPMPQRPAAAAVSGQAACQLVETGAVGYSDIEDQHPVSGSTSLGSTCRYTGDAGRVDILATSAPTTLSAFPHQLPGSRIGADTLGPVAIRVERTPMDCADEIGLPTGQVLAITYRPNPKDTYLGPLACHIVQTVSATAMALLADKSAG